MFVVHTIVSVAATAAFAAGTPSIGTVPDGAGLTAEDACVVRTALDSGDPRRVRIAREVLRGEAGVVALANPWILHHHRVDTSRPCPRS